MKRTDINILDTWDLSLIYKDLEEFEQDLNKATQILDQLLTYQNKLTQSSSKLYDFLELNTLFDCLISKLYCFTHLTSDVEPENQTNKTLEAKVMALYEKASQQLTFIDLELIEHATEVKTLLQDDVLKDYRYYVSEILRQASHTLNQEMENFIAEVSPLIDTGSEVFDNLRLEFKPVLVDGKEEFLNNATLNEFLRNKDPMVRKQAYENFFKEYQRFENVYAKTLSNTMKKDAFLAKTRHFKNSLEASLFLDQAPTSLFEKILYHANEKYLTYFHEYNLLKKQLLNQDILYNYDLSVPLVNGLDKKYTKEECFKIIKEAISPFGKEYSEVIQLAFKERWIDFYPHVGKRDGAYSSGCYDTRPYILMNFVGNYQSLSTMIHELGHSVHSYFSRKYQLPQNSEYRIFVAEVASTVNEMLLINYMLKHAKTNQEKASLLYNLLEQCTGLIYRQPFFADFEYRLHQKAEQNQPMSSQIITDLYQEMNEKYFGPEVTLSPYTKYSCYYVPHFYYNYYVYKYTLGMTCALAITSHIMKNDQEQINHYLQFLKSGGSTSPIELLKIAGVNPLEDQLYDDAFNYFKEKLDEFKTIMQEVQ